MKKIIFLLALVSSVCLNAQTVRTTASDYIQMVGNIQNTSPADAQTLYFNDMLMTSNTSTANRVVLSANSGVITKVSISLNCATGSSSESVIVGINSNGTNYNIKTDLSTAANVATYVVTGLNIPVVEGGAFIPFITTPTWATNPTTVYLTVRFYIKLNN